MSSGLYGTSTTANIDITELVERAEAAATSAEADAVSTADDAVSTAADVTTTNSNVTAAQTSETNAGVSESNAATSATNSSNSASYSAEWANKAEDSLVSAAAGGDQVDDYSALHWAAKAAASYAAIGTDYVSQTGETGAAEVPVGTTAQRPTPAAGQLRFNSTDNAFEGYDGSAWGALGGGSAWTITEVQTGALAAGDMWLVDSSVARSRDLPATPATGDEVWVKDDAGSSSTNTITVGRNGSTIMGAAEDLTITTPYASVFLKYSGTTWKVVS